MIAEIVSEDKIIVMSESVAEQIVMQNFEKAGIEIETKEALGRVMKLTIMTIKRENAR